MSDKCQKLIIRYELARSEVRNLKVKRIDLIKDCENVNEVEYPPDSGMFQETGKNCLVLAFDILMSTIDENQGEGYSYEEILNNLHCEEKICNSCYESYQIKTGPLADAKKEFGNAKRAIHYAGRKLIKDKND